MKLKSRGVVRTSSGSISLGIGNENIRVRATTNSGSFRAPSEFVVDKDTSGRSGANIRGHIGDNAQSGAELEINASSGSISLRKSQLRDDEPQKPTDEQVQE